MKRNYIWIFYLILFTISCTDEKSSNTSITNSLPADEEPDENTSYQLNLSSNAGENVETVTMGWNETDQSITVVDKNGTPYFEGSGETFQFTGMNPGEFLPDIYIELTVEDSTYRDTIQIFTRPIFPVKNFTVDVLTVWEEDGKWEDGEYFYDYNECQNPSCDDGYENNSEFEESFTDSNNNQFDPWEEYIDGNGAYDEGESWIDCNSDQSICEGDQDWDPNTMGNDIWNAGENFTDSDNNQFDPWEEYIDGNGVYDEGKENHVDGNGIYDDDDNCICINNAVPTGCSECYVDGREVYHRVLNWSPITESLGNFQEYNIYRVTAQSINDLKNTDSLIPLSTLISQNSSTYTDLSSTVLTSPGLNSFYYLVQVATSTHTRNSFIQPFNSNLESNKIILTESNVSKDRDNYVWIDWSDQTISAPTNFYQYEIQRSISSNEANIEDIIYITNSSVDHFIDRNSGDGTTKYYRIGTVYINGITLYSDFIIGKSVQ